jgi:hypothetical protein
MTPDTRPHTTCTRRRPAQRRNPQLLSDAVVASYIHEISQRHRVTGSDEARRPKHQSRM